MVAKKRLEIEVQGKDQSKAAFDSANKNAKEFTGNVSSLREKLRDYTVIAGGAISALKALSSAMKAPIDAATTQLKVELQAAAAIAQSTKNVTENLNAVKAWASELQNATGVGDEYTLGLFRIAQNLIRNVEVSRRATEAAILFEEATGKSAQGVIELFGRALQGATVSFARYGLVVDTSLKPQEQALQAIDQLIDRYTEFGNLVGGTVIGSMRKLDAAWGDFLETLGLTLLKTDTFKNLTDVLTDFFGSFDQAKVSGDNAKFLDDILKGLIRTIGFIVRSILQLAQLIQQVFTEGVSVAGFSIITGETDRLGEQIEKAETRLKNFREELANTGQQFRVDNAEVVDYGNLTELNKNRLEALTEELRKAKQAQDAHTAGTEEAKDSMSDLIKFVDDLVVKLTQYREEQDKLRQGKSPFDNLFSSAGRFGSGLEEATKKEFVLLSTLRTLKDDGLRRLAERSDIISMENVVALSQLYRDILSGKDKFTSVLPVVEENITGGFDTFIQEVQKVMAIATDLELAYLDAFTGIGEALQSTAQAAGDSFGPLLQDLTDRGVSAADAFSKMGTSIKNQFLNEIGRAIGNILLTPLKLFTKLITEAITTFIGKLIGLTAVEKALAAATTAAAVAQATVIGAAWAPAAVAAAIATLGGANAAGGLALAQIQTARIGGLAEGGVVSTPGGVFMVGEGRHDEVVAPIKPGSALEALVEGKGGSYGANNVGVSVNVGTFIGDDASAARALAELVAERVDTIIADRYRGRRR